MIRQGVHVVFSGSVFTMEGGSIIGGVHVDPGATFTMSRGSIRHGVIVDSGGTFTMEGGSVSGNNGTGNGGGVYVGGTFNMRGGSIACNSASHLGGGVYVSGGKFAVSGSPVISGNIGSQVWLAYNPYIDTFTYITIAGELTNETPIGVTMQTPGVFTYRWSDRMGDADPADYFTSESGNFLVIRSGDGEAMLAPAFGTPDFILPAETTAIGESAFEGVDMHIVYVPDTCASLGANAFKDCAGLTQIRLPKDCAISSGAFDGCTALIAVFAPAGGTTQSWCAQAGVPFAAE